MSDRLKEARNKILNGPTYRGPVTYETFEGYELEVRCPKAKHTIEGLSGGKLKVKNPELSTLLLECVFLRETGEHFFSKELLESLEDSAAHKDGIIGRLATALERVQNMTMNEHKDEVEKN